MNFVFNHDESGQLRLGEESNSILICKGFILRSFYFIRSQLYISGIYILAVPPPKKIQNMEEWGTLEIEEEREEREESEEREEK